MRLLMSFRKSQAHAVQFPLAIDVHGAIDARWLEVLHRLARSAVARRY
eukprot:SM001104S18754  [mRNA]  locus=s1104:1841:1984:- [translate_table: standard]